MLTNAAAGATSRKGPSGTPFRWAPWPRAADHVIPVRGWWTAPASAPSSSSTAILTHQSKPAVEVVHRAVERIDDPGESGARSLQSAFLTKQSVTRANLGQTVGDQLLGGPISGTDRITGRGLGLDTSRVDRQICLPGEQFLTRFLSQTDGEVARLDSGRNVKHAFQETRPSGSRPAR